MKYVLIFVLSFFLSLPLIAQKNYALTGDDSLELFRKKSYPALRSIDNKTQFHLNAGASYTSWGKNSVFSKWIAPEMSYQLNPKLTIHVGTMILNENSPISYFNSEQQQSIKPDPTRAFLYLSGDYQLNKSIRLRATTFNELKSKNPYLDAFSYNQIGIDVKLANNLFLSADFIDVRGSSPYAPFNSSRLFRMDDYSGNPLFGNIFY
jgi:hypothetical protein